MKKTLIISTWAPPSIGGPKNMYALFSQLPTDSYSILTSYYGIDNYSAKHGEWLPGKYYFYDNSNVSDEQRDRTKLTKESNQRSAISKLRHLVKRIGLVKIILGPLLIFGQIMMIVKAGAKVIKKEKIEVLMGVSDFGPALIGTYKLHKKTKIPFVIHLYDLYLGNLFPFPGGILAKYYEPKLIASASKIIVTNETTKELYIKRYGEAVREKFAVIHNSVPPEEHELSKTSVEYNPAPPYSILFSGRIYWPQIEAIKEMIGAINEMNFEITFNIYTPSPKDYLSKLGIIENNKIKINSATPQEMPALQASADILFLPLSWNTKAPEIIQTATPGKLTDYLATGKPILTYAPGDTALVKYVKNKQCAYIVEEHNPEKLKQAIEAIVTNKKESIALIENAGKAYLSDFDTKKNSLILSTLLNNFFTIS